MTTEVQTQGKRRRIEAFSFVIAAVTGVLCCVFFAASSFSDSRRLYGAKLGEKINPNDAPLGSLVRLPGIGTVRARAIVAYRESSSDEGGPAFETIEDLEKIKGIGPKTAQSLSEWLKFE